ncbi:MAG: phosphoenolpyruvate--protein phosphotransferase [Alistipes sp.]|nr:phosphoenolpyruvate--protein phosphotransferase [Candidatus Alistipes equi]
MILSSSSSVAKGIAIGKAFVFSREHIGSETKTEEDALSMFRSSLLNSHKEIEDLAKNNSIMEAQLAFLEDDYLKDTVEEFILDGKTASEALDLALKKIEEELLEIDDEYLRSRIQDVKDIFFRLKKNLGDSSQGLFQGLEKGDVLVARTLFPSELSQIDLTLLSGIVTGDGGASSHISIMAAGYSLPLVVALGDKVNEIKPKDKLIVDASMAKVYLSPDVETLREYECLLKHSSCQDDIIEDSINLPNGEKVSVFANVASLDDVRQAMRNGADGIGIFRTEFLYLSSMQAPTEQEQFQIYRDAVLFSNGKPITFRTCDIGGDKQVPFLELKHEDNPFLGLRAIRMCLRLRPDILRTQLRALLRASAYGELRIMIPMISSLDEMVSVKNIFNECREELRSKGVSFAEHVPLGMMIETPASVFLISEFVKISDFFSIGTNDLTQYILAVDRANPDVAPLYKQTSEAVLSAVKMVIGVSRQNSVECGMCGELAADESMTEKLLRMGLGEFSVPVGMVQKIKHRIVDFTVNEKE